MSQPRTATRSLLFILAALAVMMLGADAATAGAQSYGELSKPFSGSGANEFKILTGALAHAFGVDPTDNSVYVGDQPKKENEFRVQKYTAGGSFVASVSLKFKPSDRVEGIEGIAVDPVLKRIYVLTVYEREEESAVEPEEFAAGALYAFKTEPSGTTLVPAEGTNSEGVLVSAAAMHAQSEEAGTPTSALLEPAGIALDPTTHDVIVLGHEDVGGEKLQVAAQRVGENGTLGARWVDSGECFEVEGEEGAASCPKEGPAGAQVDLEPGEPYSPVVTTTGRVLVDLPQEVWEIPKSFAANTPPEPVVRFGSEGLQTLLSPPFFTPREGGGLTFVREAGEGEGEGRLYQATAVLNTPPHSNPGVVVFKLAKEGTAPEELGWTAGNSKVALEEKTSETCAISAFSQPLLGAGKGEELFVFDPNVPSGESQKSPHPQVETFGPGGHSCPTATSVAPAATLNGTPIGSTSNPAHVGQKVALSSAVTGANVLSVQWSFGDGTSETVTKEQFQTAKVEHAFTAEGTYKVSATIKTDDLAEPTIKTPVATVIVAAANPTAQFTTSAAPTTGSAVKFTSTSLDENKSAIVKYAWNFGDGSESSTGPTVEHTYSQAGEYTVSLTVTDALGLSGTTSHKVAVSAPSTPPPSGGGGGGGGGGTSTPSSPPPGTGVLPSKTVGNPEAKLASSALSVATAGSFPVKVSCPAGESACSGTITLKTLTAISAGKGKKKAVLTLASGSFTVTGGSAKTITLHLSAKAKALLAHSHTLRARATLVAHDATGASRTTNVTVTLKLTKKK
jgi:PKD repeat protein